jgi:5-methylcytosine-specific restriction enzyme A
LFINGVFESVLEEICEVQTHLPHHIMFLQPYSTERIVRLAEQPPSVDDRVRLFISTTQNLAQVHYTAEIVGWQHKSALSEAQVRVLQRLIWTLQPQEGGLYYMYKDEGRQSANLLHVWQMQKLRNPFSVTELIRTNTGESLSPNRTTAGGWSYVRNPDDGWLAQFL